MEFIISKRIVKSVQEYCKINGLDVNIYLNDLIEKAHASHVYGEQPNFIKSAKTNDDKPVLENEINHVLLEKKSEISSKDTTGSPPNSNDIQVVEMNKKQKVRILK